MSVVICVLIVITSNFYLNVQYVYVGLKMNTRGNFSLRLRWQTKDNQGQITAVNTRRGPERAGPSTGQVYVAAGDEWSDNRK